MPARAARPHAMSLLADSHLSHHTLCRLLACCGLRLTKRWVGRGLGAPERRPSIAAKAGLSARTVELCYVAIGRACTRRSRMLDKERCASSAAAALARSTGEGKNRG